MSDCRATDDLDAYERMMDARGDIDDADEIINLLTSDDGQEKVYKRLKKSEDFYHIICQLMEMSKNQDQKDLAGMSMRIIEAIESVAGKIVEGM